ncbi:MAG: sulfite exporter TauE/SafE family protein [Pseudomonadales bacterium]
MGDIDTILFLAFVVVGAIVQTITGFAMGLIVIGGVTVFDLVPIEVTAAVVSFISLVNTGVALRSTYKFIDYTYFRNICIGMIPFLIGGVVLLELLRHESYVLLRTVLGIVIISAGVLMMLKPAPWPRRSSPLAAGAIGCAGGLLGGLYSTAGPPFAYFMYRQPVDIIVIRATLLAIFAVATSGRTIVAGLTGHLTSQVLLITAIAIPLVIIVTMITSRFTRYIPDVMVRRLAFALLIMIGGVLIVT